MTISNWFTGVVEDVNDPLQIGRVRVRCFNYHTPNTFDIPTEDLPWATCILPVTSASTSGIGCSATGLLQGSWVFGFFRDGSEMQDPVVLGSIPSVSSPVDSANGFSDPHGVFPLVPGPDIPGGATTYGYGSNDGWGAQNAEFSNFNSFAVGNSSYAESFQGPPEQIQVNGNIGRLISVARGELGVRETSKNQGPGIAKYWNATNIKSGYNSRLHWCAAFVCWCIQQSGLFSEQDRPKTAAAFKGGGFESWARSKAPAAILTMRPTRILVGDLVIFSFSHIGIAVTGSDANGNFRAIEGNTSNGVFEKSRRLSQVRSAITININS
jgi:hypothetical protein